jgi:outer membrane protein assembly factor BamB
MINNNMMKKLFFSFLAFVILSSCTKENNEILKYRKNLEAQNFYVPKATNGIVTYFNQLVCADLLAGRISIVDKYSGKINAQYFTSKTNATPDDLVVLSDSSIVWTAPQQGKIFKTNKNGISTFLAKVPSNVNPIAKSSSDTAVYVGFSTGIVTPLIRINTSSGKKTTLISNFLPVNGFDIINNNLLYAPVTDVESLNGKGKIVKVDLSDNSYNILPITFANEPQKKGFIFSTGVVAGESGVLYVMEAINPKVYRVDINTNRATLFADLPTTLADNITYADGTVYVTSFTGNRIYAIGLNNSIQTLYIKP